MPILILTLDDETLISVFFSEFLAVSHFVERMFISYSFTLSSSKTVNILILKQIGQYVLISSGNLGEFKFTSYTGIRKDFLKML